MIGDGFSQQLNASPRNSNGYPLGHRCGLPFLRTRQPQTPTAGESGSVASGEGGGSEARNLAGPLHGLYRSKAVGLYLGR